MKKSLLLLVVLFYSYHGSAQVTDSTIYNPRSVYTIKGDYYFNHGNYNAGVENYKKSINENPNDTRAMLQVAESYHRLGNDAQAAYWFGKALNLTGEQVDGEYLLSYLSALHKTGNYDTLEQWATIYTNRAYKNNTSHDDAAQLLHTIPSINSQKADISPVLYRNKLFFSSNRTNNDFSLYSSSITTPGHYGQPVSLLEPLSDGTTEGPMTIARNTGRLFFTGTRETAEGGSARMEILFCDIPSDPADQVKINKLNFKNFKFSMGHPVVSSDGNLLFFTSTNPKNKRGFDLYSTAFSGKGWSTPKALGSGINTNGDEMYPSLVNDSILYFASNGHGGLGGFDVYRINLYAKNAHPEHLNAPFNSTSDDLSLIFTNNDREGYLVSNRAGGIGAEDIYKFYLLPARADSEVSTTKNKSGSEGLSIYTSRGKEIKLADGNKRNFSFEFVPGTNYTLITDHDSHETGVNTPAKKELPKRNIYTFHIQKSRGGLFDQRKVQDIHVKPGDLVTFQLIPKPAKNTKPENSRIRFNKQETVIPGMDTIVFSYVADDEPETPEPGGAPVLASVDDKDNTPNITTDEKDTNAASEKNAAAQLPEFILADNQSRKSQPASSVPIGTTEPAQELKQNTPAIVTPTATVNNKPAETSGNTEATKRPSSPPESNKKNTSIVDAAKTNHETTTVTPTAAATATPPPVIASESTDKIPQETSPENVMDDDPDLKFRVQIAAARSSLSESQLRKIYDGSRAVLSFNEDGYVKYYIVETPSYPEARQVLTESGVKNGFIAAYKGGVKWKLQDAIAVQKHKTTTPEKIPNEIHTNAQPLISKTESVPEEDRTHNEIPTQPKNNVTSLTNTDQSALTLPADITETSASNDRGNSNVTTGNETSKDETRTQQPVVSTSIANIQGPDSDVTEKVLPTTTIEKTSPDEGYWARNVSKGKEFKYRVQIAASRSEISARQLKEIYNGPLEIRSFKEDGYHKYYIHETPSYYIAKRTLSESNVDKAFITAWKENTKWNVQEAIAVQYEVPDVKKELPRNDSIIKIVTVNFEIDEYKLPADQAIHIREYVVLPMKDNGTYYAIVNGYTDIRGTEAYNYGLSQERAFFVEQLIVHEGIDPGRVSMRYFGESQVLRHCPENDTCDESVHQANRRVEVLLLMTQQ